jgi:hypothetical protein
LLSEAFAKFPPGDPGSKYVEACEFVASVLVGHGLHVSKTFQEGEAEPVVQGTPRYEDMRDLVSDEICEKLHKHADALSWRRSVRTDAVLFWETFFKTDAFLEGEEVDVYLMVQDGTLLKMMDIRQSPAAVERAREIHEAFSRTCDGYA